MLLVHPVHLRYSPIKKILLEKKKKKHSIEVILIIIPPKDHMVEKTLQRVRKEGKSQGMNQKAKQ